MANSYTWTTTGSGNWSTVSDWFDVTAGTLATATPGPTDAAEIDNPGTGTITITGPAGGLDLSVSGQVTLAGNDTIGSLTLGVPPFDPSFFGPTLVSTIALAGTFVASSLDIGDLHGVPGFSSDQVADYGLVEVDSGSMLSAGSGTVNAGDLRVDGGAVSIGKDLFLGVDLAPGSGFPQVVPVTAGSLDVSNHGNVQLANLSITDGEVSLDATSTLEIGGAGTATAGTITIDPDAYLEEGDPISSIESPIRAAETIQISGPILNNGNLDTDQNVSDVINNGTIFFQHSTLSFINGNGQILLDEDGTIGPGVSGTLNVVYGETIDIALGTGVPIDGTDTPPIANFGNGIIFQTIVVQGITADTAIYTATGPGIGTLALDNGATQVASLTMLGTYASDAFIVTPGTGDSVVTLRSPAADSYTWAAAGSGDWGSASNWSDVTTGMPAVVAPGSAATTAIDNPGTGTFTVTGPADVLNLSVSGDVTLAGNDTIGSFTLAVPPFNPSSFGPTLVSTIALAGSFAASSLDIGDLHGVAGFPSIQVADYGLIEVDQGAMLSAGTVAVRSGDLRVDSGAVNIGNSLTLGTIFLAPSFPPLNFFMTGGSLEDLNHGSVQLGSLAIADGSVSLDATSTLEIGNAGTAAAGTITVDPGADLEFGVPFNFAAVITESPTLAISSPVLNNGHIGTDTDLSHVINNGTISVTVPAFGTHPTLSFISGNGQIELASIGEPFTIGPGVSGTLDLDHVPEVIFSLGAGVPVEVSDTPRIANFGLDGTSDTIVLDGISADTATYTPTGAGIGTLTLENGSTEVATLALLGTYASNAFSVAAGSGDTALSLNPPCFAAGTRIATPRGEVPVEALCSGDEVALASGGTAPIVWIGRRRVDCRSHPEPQQVWPVRISRGAFAPGVPRRDLLLSPDHAVFVDGVLIPIKYLLNCDTIRQAARDTVVYFHLELPAHDLVLADGLAAESYLDTGDRNSFENAGCVVSLFPGFSSLAWEAYGYAPLVVTGPEVDTARRRIDMRARDLAVARPQRRRHGIA